VFGDPVARDVDAACHPDVFAARDVVEEAA
jgi:hypothetical protein